MSKAAAVLVLGANGLAGRAIVSRLLEKTTFDVIAAGRDGAKLQALQGDRISPCVLDVNDCFALADACGRASLVINAVGPFALNGAAIARVVLECDRPYIDCANEQRHYHNLMPLDELAKRRGLPLVTAAGAFPGVSTLLAARVLEQVKGVAALDCCCIQFRHAYADSGLASIMGAILEATEQPYSIQRGELMRTRMGRSSKLFALPEPFGQLRLLEVPLVYTFTLPARFSLSDYHAWFYVGDMPAWTLELVTHLQPNRRRWVYRMVERIVRGMNRRSTQKAIEAGVGAECLISATATSANGVHTASVLFRDGAIATACLPVWLADAFLRGAIRKTGVLSSLDLVDSQCIQDIIQDAGSLEFHPAHPSSSADTSSTLPA